jgi:hypothetical protein
MADMSPASSLGPPTAKSTITPQQAKYIANIKTALSNNSLTVVVGAGVSINAIYGSRRISGDDLKRVVESMSWLGLLLHGLDYLREEELLSDPDDEKERVGHIRILRPQSPTSAPTEDKLRAAASFLKRKLTECNKLDNWFDLEFEGIYQKCINHDPNPILDALKDLYLCGARIITTNYDDLLEKHIGADRIVIDNTPASKMFFAKRNLGILHVHGVWWYSTGTVLDDMDYRRTTEDEVLQQNLKNSLSASEVLLFVGTGAGLSDPNFGNLLAWAAKQNDGLAQRNCVLARREEKVDTNLNNLNILWYGQNHEDLPMFLNELASSCKRT